jgi:glycine cleavage system H lipoate-binding protein
VVVITGYGTIETAVQTVQSGAMDYIQKPFTEDELLAFVNTAVIKRQDRLEKQARHKIHLVRPGIGESKSRFELNVPAGAFVSPQHAWARIELNGAVRIGLDELIRKVFGHVDRVDLPTAGKKITKGEKLFSITYGDYVLDIPSPFTGKVISVNTEHVEHPDWLTIKPFELSWMCRIEPTNLAAELPGLKIGRDAVDWYQQELDRYDDLAREAGAEALPPAEEGGATHAGERNLLEQFSRPFLQC